VSRKCCDLTLDRPLPSENATLYFQRTYTEKTCQIRKEMILMTVPMPVQLSGLHMRMGGTSGAMTVIGVVKEGTGIVNALKGGGVTT
jgi:hypothetical protein